MIYPSLQENFLPHFQLASNFVWHNGKMLLLHRNNGKFQGGKWGQPAGKLEEGENPVQAAARELYEETGIVVPEKNFQFWTILHVQHNGRDFVDHMFSIHLDESPEVKLNYGEHQNYNWFTLEEALKLHLVDDFDECIKLYAVDHF